MAATSPTRQRPGWASNPAAICSARSSTRLSARWDAFSVENGWAYVTIPIAEADAILRERRRLAVELGELPG